MLPVVSEGLLSNVIPTFAFLIADIQRRVARCVRRAVTNVNVTRTLPLILHLFNIVPI
jgi:hypothetical protein